MAINLKKFETLPGKLNELVQELGLNEEAERKILEQYKRKLHYIKKDSSLHSLQAGDRKCRKGFKAVPEKRGTKARQRRGYPDNRQKL